MKPTPAKLTYEDLLSFPDDGLRHELIDGEHYVTPSPATIHQRLVGGLYGALFVYFQTHPIGEAFIAPFDVILSIHDVVEPDLLVVLSNQSEIVTDQNVRGAPAIVVEVASPSTRRRDDDLKRRLYERAGVLEYWRVDPDARCVTISMWAAVNRQAMEQILAADDTLTSTMLPGFSLPLAVLFR